MVKTQTLHRSACIAQRTILFDVADVDAVPIHFHNRPHLTYCILGSALVEVLTDDLASVQASAVLLPGDSYTIDGDKRHRITALLDNTRVDCLFPWRELDGTVVDADNGNDEAHTNRADAPTPEILMAIAQGVDTHGNSSN